MYNFPLLFSGEGQSQRSFECRLVYTGIGRMGDGDGDHTDDREATSRIARVFIRYLRLSKHITLLGGSWVKYSFLVWTMVFVCSWYTLYTTFIFTIFMYIHLEIMFISGFWDLRYNHFTKGVTYLLWYSTSLFQTEILTFLLLSCI